MPDNSARRLPPVSSRDAVTDWRNCTPGNFCRQIQYLTVELAVNSPTDLVITDRDARSQRCVSYQRDRLSANRPPTSAVLALHSDSDSGQTLYSILRKLTTIYKLP